MSTPSERPSDGQEPPPSRWQKFRMVVKVVELRLRFIALMAGTGLVFGYWDTIVNRYEKYTRPAAERQAAADGVEFYCPMHPTVVQAGPGGCPICGMPLSKRRQGAPEALPAGVTARVALSPLGVAQAGVKAVAVGYAPLAETVTTVGSVTFDESRLARISSKVKGMSRVEALHVNVTGARVKAGAPLAEVYSPELYQAVRELLIARKAERDRAQVRPRSASGRSLLGDGGAADLVALAREKLTLWGLTPAQVDTILATGEAGPRVPILAPIGGVVVKKEVVEGQYVAEGEPMFEVADLGHVWVQAQVYEADVSLVRLGQEVEATVEAYPGEVFRGVVAFIDPALNPSTRTLNVRYDLDNPGERLLPGMFATVTLRAPVADSPAFRGRPARAAQGGPARSAAEQEVCPVTTLKLGAMGTPVAADVGGKTVWACCAACLPKLKATPAKYLARLAPAPRGAVLSVPESAVIDTGTTKVVYVETEPGVFEGRSVLLGPLVGDRYPVLEGLSPGESVAAAGAFLIDAETRLHAGPAAEHPAAAPAPAAPRPQPSRPPAPAHDHPATRSAAAGGDRVLR